MLWRMLAYSTLAMTTRLLHHTSFIPSCALKSAPSIVCIGTQMTSKNISMLMH